MFASHRPKVYRSRLGCCICGAKSSSSRFTSSQKYETLFAGCFRLTEKRQGEICNACVLLVKRWKKLPTSSAKNWKHVSISWQYVVKICGLHFFVFASSSSIILKPPANLKVVDSKANTKKSSKPRILSRSHSLESEDNSIEKAKIGDDINAFDPQGTLLRGRCSCFHDLELTLTLQSLFTFVVLSVASPYDVSFLSRILAWWFIESLWIFFLAFMPCSCNYWVRKRCFPSLFHVISFQSLFLFIGWKLFENADDFATNNMPDRKKECWMNGFE